jgi:hypothetical protein
VNAARDLADPALAALVREHSSETPPAHVDAAILAAAHRAVDSAPRGAHARATQPWRWWMPLAAAAVIAVVVIGVLPLAPTVLDDASRVASDTGTATQHDSARDRLERPLPDTAAPRAHAPSEPSKVTRSMPATPSTSSAAPALPDATKASRPPASLAAEAPAKPASRLTPSPGAQGPANAAPSEPTLEAQRSQALAAPTNEAAASQSPSLESRAGETPAPMQQRAAAGQTSAPVTTPAAEASRDVANGAPQPGSAEWIARLRALRDAGHSAEAERELRRFRAVFDDADARLPDDLREWARSVH